MSVVRRFLIAPSLVRLLRKERGGTRTTEGFFAPQGGRTSMVRIEGQECHLILAVPGAPEERTVVPRAHGDALLDVCPGKAIYERTTIPLGNGREAQIDRYTTPAGLDLVGVRFDNEDQARGFLPPVWFGQEVSSDAAYERSAIALQGAPRPGEVSLSNAALEAVLDLIEPRFGLRPPPAPPPSAPPKPPESTRPFEAPKPAEAKAAELASAVPPAPEPPQPAEAAAAAPEPAEAASPEPVTVAEEAAPEAPKPDEAPKAPEGDNAVDALKRMVEQNGAPAEAKGEAKPANPNGSQDARIDDVIESLSQALGAALQQPRSPEPPPAEDDVAASFERWTVRPRRTQG